MTEIEKIEKHIDMLVERLWFWQDEVDACLDEKRKAKLIDKCDQIENRIESLRLQAESL